MLNTKLGKRFRSQKKLFLEDGSNHEGFAYQDHDPAGEGLQAPSSPEAVSVRRP
jgi:hypothetical protein